VNSDRSKFEISKVYVIRLQSVGIRKILVCGKNSIPLDNLISGILNRKPKSLTSTSRREKVKIL